MSHSSRPEPASNHIWDQLIFLNRDEWVFLIPSFIVLEFLSALCIALLPNSSLTRTMSKINSRTRACNVCSGFQVLCILHSLLCAGCHRLRKRGCPLNSGIYVFGWTILTGFLCVWCFSRAQECRGASVKEF